MIYLKTSVGIELRGEDMVIACLSSNFAAGVFTHYKRVEGYRTRDRGEVRGEVERYFKSERLGRDNVVLGIPRSDVLIRHLDLPREVEDNLKQVVLYQVQSFEPSDEEKFYHDYVRVPPAPTDKRLHVLLVMVQKPILDGYLELLRELGVNPVGVTVGSFGLANLFLQTRRNATGKTFILADLKRAGLEIMAVRDGTVAYTRKSQRNDGGPWKPIVLQEIELAASKIRLGPGEVIDELVLAGEGAEAALAELGEGVEDCKPIGTQLQFEMEVGRRTHLDEGAAALGLAYCGISRRPPIQLNLLPQQLRIQQTRWAYVPSIVLGLVILALSGGFAFRGAIQEQIMLRKLDAELGAMTVPFNRVTRLRSEVQAAEKKLAYIEGIYQKRDMNLEILQELTAILPPDTFLNLYGNVDGTIQVAGSSSSAETLIPKIERSPLMKQVQQRGVIFKDAQTGKDRFNFEAKVER